MEVIQETRFLKIELDLQNNILLETWKKESEEMRREDFRTELLNQVHAVKKYKVPNVLTDNRELLYTIDLADQRWMNEVAFPSFLENGARRIALLLSQEIFTQVSVEQTFDETNGRNFQQRFFTDRDLALAWLR